MTTAPPAKRGRTSASESGYLSPTEELNQVNNLVERRRVQNRISQRNYRNKIRSRLEALEAMVEQSKQNKAQKAATASGESTGTSTPKDTTPRPRSNSELSIAKPDLYPTGSQAGQYGHSRTLSFCKCMLDPSGFLNINGTDFEPMCECNGSNNDPDHQSGPLAGFLDTDAGDQMYAGLQSPDSLQCNSPGTLNADLANLDCHVNMHMGDAATISSPPEALALSTMDTTIQPAYAKQQPPAHSPYPYPYPFAMGSPMMPMGFMAVAANTDYAMQPQPDHMSRASSASSGVNARAEPSFHSSLPHQLTPPLSTAMQPFMWVPAPMVMVPVHAAHMPHHHPSNAAVPPTAIANGLAPAAAGGDPTS